MQRLKGPGTLTLVGMWLVIWPLMAFVPQRPLLEVLNSLVLGGCLGILVTFSRSTWEILKWSPLYWTARDVFILGVNAISAGLLIIYGDLWWSRLIYSVPANGGFIFGRWTLIIGIWWLLMAAGSEDGRIPGRLYRRMGLLAAGTAVIGLGLMALGLG